MKNKSENIIIKQTEINFVHIKSSGPGGQNINKVSTGVQLIFDINSSSLKEDVKQKLKKLGGKRVSKEGVLIIEAKRFRTQGKNKEDALQRLYDLIRESAKVKKKRKKTRPSKASAEARLEFKKRRAYIKNLRKKI